MRETNRYAIVRETNRYAIVLNHLDRIHRGTNWEDLTISGLKSFMAMALYMGMKNQPN